MSTSYTALANLQSRALPASGAYYTGSTAAALQGEWVANHDGGPTISFRVTYTAGASGGYPVMKVVWTVLDASASEVTMIDTITTAAASGGVCTTDVATNKLVALTDGSSTACDVVYVVPRDAVKVQVQVAELGNTGTPGTVTVDMFGRL
jgi:hypothetical protein